MKIQFKIHSFKRAELKCEECESCKEREHTL